MTDTEKFWGNLIKMSLETDDDEINCGECMDMLDQYVDLLDAGQDPATVLPELEQHLHVCHCCHTELEALMVAIKSAIEPEE